MNIEQILSVIDGRLITPDADLSIEVEMACGADLMSDVLAFTHSGTLLLSGLTNPQVVRTSEMAGIKAIVFVRGKKPPAETIELAEAKGIPLLASRFTMFETCGLLYASGLASCDLYAQSTAIERGGASLGPASTAM